MYRGLKRAHYWSKQVAKAQNKKQVELWSKIENEAYAHVRNTLFLLNWLEEKRPKNIESELDVIVVEPKSSQMLIPKKGFHRSFSGLLLPDKRERE